ncbi:MAG: hypothetical protein HGA85_07500 [Nanoarchaeota archaeon]|nr:hypothetical protein [Nanoarchaeota archaeon]
MPISKKNLQIKTINKPKIEKSKKDKVIDTLYKELQRKDKMIEKLKEENRVLVKLALRYADKKKLDGDLRF